MRKITLSHVVERLAALLEGLWRFDEIMRLDDDDNYLLSTHIGRW